MTARYDFAISRRDAPGVLHFVCPLREQRAQGRPGARRTRGLAGCCRIDMLPTSIQVWRIHTGLPRAMALRLIRDRPGDPALCDTIALGQRWPPSNLTPASGRRTQSISPYAKAALVSRDPASIASLPLVCDDGPRPTGGTGCGISTSDFPILPAIYFCVEGWTYILG